MKCHVQCAGQQKSSSKITKCCTCREKLVSLMGVTQETSFPMRGATAGTLQSHQILFLPRKMMPNIWHKFLENRWNVISNARPSRPWSEHEPKNGPSMNPSVRNPAHNRGYFSRSARAFCMKEINIMRSSFPSKFHKKVTLQLYQIVRLPRKRTLMIDPCLHMKCHLQ